MGIEHRIHERRAVVYRVVVVTENNTRQIQGATIDLSIGGAGILLDEDMAMGSNCTLHLRFPAAQGFIFLALPSKVVFNILASNTSQYRIGLKFTELSAEAEATLKKALR